MDADLLACTRRRHIIRLLLFVHLSSSPPVIAATFVRAHRRPSGHTYIQFPVLLRNDNQWLFFLLM